MKSVGFGKCQLKTVFINISDRDDCQSKFRKYTTWKEQEIKSNVDGSHTFNSYAKQVIKESCIRVESSKAEFL